MFYVAVFVHWKTKQTIATPLKKRKPIVPTECEPPRESTRKPDTTRSLPLSFAFRYACEFARKSLLKTTTTIRRLVFGRLAPERRQTIPDGVTTSTRKTIEVYLNLNFHSHWRYSADIAAKWFAPTTATAIAGTVFVFGRPAALCGLIKRIEKLLDSGTGRSSSRGKIVHLCIENNNKTGSYNEPRESRPGEFWVPVMRVLQTKRACVNYER